MKVERPQQPDRSARAATTRNATSRTRKRPDREAQLAGAAHGGRVVDRPADGRRHRLVPAGRRPLLRADRAGRPGLRRPAGRDAAPRSRSTSAASCATNRVGRSAGIETRSTCRRDGGSLAGKQVLYQSGVTLPPGRFSVKVVVRENATGTIGSFEAPITSRSCAMRAMKVSSVGAEHAGADGRPGAKTTTRWSATASSCCRT